MPETTSTKPSNLKDNAHALRPVRIIGGKLRTYEAYTFKNPWAGINQYLRQLNAMGMLKDDGSDCLLDILSENGDIIQDYAISKDGFEYLRRKLNFKRID